MKKEVPRRESKMDTPVRRPLLEPADQAWLEAYIEGKAPESETDDLPIGGGEILGALAHATLASDAQGIVEVIEGNEEFFHIYGNESGVRKMLLMALGVGEKQENPDCLCYLGALYYGDDPAVGEDYAKAAEYYERASRLGSSQGSVNLGYCYYYGRHQERDYAKAFKCFTLSYALDGNPEAAWKLGDMYDRGLFVERNQLAAFRLYLEAFDKTQDSPMCARPAHHLADMAMRETGGPISFNPRAALELYVMAELAYYTEIDRGLTYYTRALEEAIAGQQEARAAIERERGGDWLILHDD